MTSFVASPFALPDSSPSSLTAVRLRSNPVWGPLPRLRRDVLGTFLEFAKEGDAITFRVLNQTIHLLTHPDHLKHVLVDRPKSYRKSTRGYQEMRKVVGNGLLTSEGDFWLRQRRLASPAFHRKRIENFAQAFVSITADEQSKWTGQGEVRDIAHDMMAITLRIVEKTLLSREAGADTERVGDALNVGLAELTYRMNSPWALPLAIPTPHNLRFRRAIGVLDHAVATIVGERRRNGPVGDGDLLDMLMETLDEKGEAMTDTQLRDEVLTILLAGHETTAMALSWTLMLLAQNPAIESQVHDEIIRVCGDRTPSLADLPALSLLDRVLHESMRLYPPAWIIARAAVEDDDVPGLRVRRGEWTFLSPYVVHRRPDFWPDPLRFDPDRFLPDAVAARHRYAWVPFSAGQRKCIGDQFAMMEARLVLATLLQKHRFELASDVPVGLDPLVTLRPRGGMPMRVRSRNYI